MPIRRSLVVLAFAAVLCARAQESREQLLQRGQSDLQQGKYEAAVTDFRTALSENPALSARARFPLAGALLKLNRTSEARRELETIRRDNGDSSEVLYYLGMVNMLELNYPAAIEYLSKATANSPYADTAYQLGYACVKASRWADAEKWLKAAVKANPQDEKAFYQLGLAYRQQGRTDDARLAFDKSTALRQQRTAELQAEFVCRQKLERGTREEARDACGKLFDPTDAAKLTQLGLAFGKSGDFEAALRPFEQAAELLPDDPRAQYNLAVTLVQLQRFAQARQVLTSALAKWPDEPHLKDLYREVSAGFPN